MTANSNVEADAVADTAAGTRTVRFEIYRYDPDKDAKPYMSRESTMTRCIRFSPSTATT